MWKAAPLVAVFLVSLLAAPARAEIKPHEVLVVVNDASPISQAIGAYYSALRAIPAANQFHLPVSTPTSEVISRTVYNAAIRDPIAQYLQTTAPALKTQIRCILLTKGCPLTVANTTGSGTSQTVASVDSELTQLFTGNVPDGGQQGWLGNPYYGQGIGFDQFSSPAISYLVCRLDGYADQIDPGTGVPVDIKNLIDRAQTPAAAGLYLLDGDPTKSGGYAVGETWLTNAKNLLTSSGLTVHHDQTTAFQKDFTNLLGYASWGSNDSNNLGPPYYGTIQGHTVPGNFLPGSLATDYVSTSARTFEFGAPYGQSLIADLIRMGCTAANGHVAEPYLTACAQPDWVFPNYARGFTAAEAFYTSIAYLSWENVVVCDPLMKRMQVVSQVLSVSNAVGGQGGGFTFTVSGKNFSTLGDTVVAVGGVPAQVTSVNGTTILAKSPPNSPGPKPIVVVNSSGTFPAPQPYVVTPAITSQQTSVGIGQTFSFTVYGQFFGDAWIVFEGGYSATPFPLPPFGDFLLDVNSSVSEIASGQMTFAQKIVNVSLPVPNVPALQGTTHYLQGLTGGGFGGAGIYLLTNAIVVTVN